MSRRNSDPKRTKKVTQPSQSDRAAARRARRRLIQTLALGGGITSSKLIPGNWITPTVKAVLLPAHATGSVCVLANSEAFPIGLVEREAGPGATESMAQQLADTLLPEALAVDGLEYELLGCFRIELCDGRPRLYALAAQLGGDNIAEEISAEFDFGENSDLHGYCFRVDLINPNLARLWINFGSCDELQGPIELLPNVTDCELGDLSGDAGP